MGQVDPGRIAGSFVRVEHEALAHHDLGLVPREGADTQLGALQVDQDRHRRADALLDPAQERDALGEGVPGQVAHVDAEHVGPRLVQPAYHVLRVGGWA